MERELATVATEAVLGFFRRALAGMPDRSLDRRPRRVLDVLDRLGRGDRATHVALAALRVWPEDPVARAVLEERVAAGVHHHRLLRRDLSRGLGPARPARRRFLAAAAPVLLVLLAAGGGLTGAYLRDYTTVLDTKTDLTSAGGWSYRVSEAHLRTSPAGRGRLRVAFDITVENRLDRPAPGIGFHLAREQKTMSAGCGGRPTGWLGPITGYTPDIVPGWCVSRPAGLVGGVSCAVGTIPPSGHGKIRCVDPDPVATGFDLDSLRVYYLADLPRLTEIPTSR